MIKIEIKIGLDQPLTDPNIGCMIGDWGNMILLASATFTSPIVHDAIWSPAILHQAKWYIFLQLDTGGGAVHGGGAYCC